MSLALAPAVWMTHFLAVYALVSLACPAELAGLVRPGVALATLGALGFFAWFGFSGYRRARGAAELDGSGTSAAPFIAHANALLCLLSFVGTAWVALPAFLLEPCAT
jgi:hypothetical protein